MTEQVRGRRHEFFGVIILMFALLLLVFLITFDPADPSFNSASHRERPDNRIGPFGAYAADCLFQAFGYAAYLLLPPLIVLSLKLMFGRQIGSGLTRVMGILLFIASSSTILHLLLSGRGETAFKPGGFTGVVLADDLTSALGVTGAWILAVGGLVLGILA